MENFSPGQTYPELYEQLFKEKIQHHTNEFAEYLPAPPDGFASPAEHYRMRAEFKIWHEGAQSFYTMHEVTPPHKKIFLDRYPIGSQTINSLMPALINKIHSNSILRDKLFSIEFLTNKSGDAVITLLYHKKLCSDWQKQAELLSNEMNQNIVGRSKKQKVTIGKDYITEAFDVGNKNYCYRQTENSFTQPNPFINEKMLNWIFNITKKSCGDLLELYCGNGNFTLPMAKNFNRVLATEINKVSIKSAIYNIENNAFTNIALARLSSEEAAQAIDRERTFRRLSHIDINDYNFSTIFVDPPRAGLDNKTLHFASQFEKICYISCNPETLKQNLQFLNRSHQVKHCAFFDQFPYTQHLECGVVLTKK